MPLQQSLSRGIKRLLFSIARRKESLKRLKRKRIEKGEGSFRIKRKKKRANEICIK
jgi:hypothetical protein